MDSNNVNGSGVISLQLQVFLACRLLGLMSSKVQLCSGCPRLGSLVSVRLALLKVLELPENLTRFYLFELAWRGHHYFKCFFARWGFLPHSCCYAILVVSKVYDNPRIRISLLAALLLFH